MPKWFKVLTSRVRGWLSPRRVDAEFDAELRTHLDMLVEENLRRGMTPDAATRAARVALGGVTQLKEQYRERSGLPWIESLWQDARFALRVYGRNRGFTALAVLTVAVGIGVNTTVFTVVDAVLFKPLPVRNADRLVRLQRWFDSGARGDVQYAFSWTECEHYRQHIRMLSDVIAVRWPSRVSMDDSALEGLIVSDNYFAALGATAAMGRTFLPSNSDQDRTDAVVVLSDGAWRTRFGANPKAVGRTVRMNGAIVTVIGVMPASFIGTGNPPQVPEFWAPLEMQTILFPGEGLQSRPGLHRLQLLAYTVPGLSLAQAQAELEVVRSQVVEEPETHIAGDRTIKLALQPATYFGGTDDLRFRATVALVMGVVAMILLVACANLANMLLARASARRKEIGMRLALGATRSRLVRQLLTENVLLSTMGGIIGFVFSAWASQMLWILVDQLARPMFFTDVPFVASMKPDLRIFGFAFGLSLVSGLLVGLSPALTASRSGLGAVVSSGQRSRLRAWSIGAQAAVAMAFLICAGLLVKGVGQSASADAGFDTRKVFTLLIGFDAFDANPEKARALQDRIAEELTRTPGIEGVALLDRFPFAGTWSPPVIVEADGRRLATRTLANYVSPAYFQTTGIPIQRGRTFTVVETTGASGVAIVSESAARRFWPGEDPIGKRLSLDLTFSGTLTAFDVVGVAKDVRSANLSRPDPAYVYLPTRPGVRYNLLIRSAKGPTATYATVRDVVEAMSPTAASGIRVLSLHDGPMMQSQLLMTRLVAEFAVVLACIALVLAAVGVYGVTAYLVSQRTQEIGIRMALGATAGDVSRLIVRKGVAPVFVGAMVGLVLAGGASTALNSTLITPSTPDLLFGVSHWDPVAFVVLPMLLAAIAATASYVPARRATKVDPLLALRCE
jgi:macrolide transport system ATP-binding/permease protein